MRLPPIPIIARLARDLPHDALRARCRAIRRAGGDASTCLREVELAKPG